MSLDYVSTSTLRKIEKCISSKQETTHSSLVSNIFEDIATGTTCIVANTCAHGIKTLNALLLTGGLVVVFLIGGIPSCDSERPQQTRQPSGITRNATPRRSNGNSLGSHRVQGHWRDTPSSGRTWVRPHTRSNPD